MSRAIRSRRAVLAGGATALASGLSGCSLLGGSRKGATDVVVHSEAAASVTVAVTVTDAGAEEPHVDTTVTLAPTETATPTETDKLPAGGDYVVRVAVEGGPSETYRWEDVRIDRAPLHVVVDDSANILFALQVG